MGAGRPTDYDPKYCDELINHCSTGLSFESFAGVISVSRDTLYEWRKRHTEFSDAANIAKESCRKYWEEKGRDGTIGELDRFNAGSWQFIMKNFFRDEWRDKQEVESTNKNLNVNATPGELHTDGVTRIMELFNSAREKRDSSNTGESAVNP